MYVALLLIGLVFGCQDMPPDLDAVDDFLYQLQDVSLEAVAESAYDLVIMDYSADGSDEAAYTAAEIARLRASSKLVLAYMSIGEAEAYRFYWDEGAAWLDAENPAWEGNYKVRYWDPAWQAIILDYTDRLLAAGFDGAYLDLIDAYTYYPERETAAADMVMFVGRIADHAREQDPDFYIIVQNAAELGARYPAYLDRVDGIGQEDIYYGYEADDMATPVSETKRLEAALDGFIDAGKVVLTIAYASTPAHIDAAYARSRARGYIPFVTVRDLDQLTIHHEHDPDSP